MWACEACSSLPSGFREADPEVFRPSRVTASGLSDFLRDDARFGYSAAPFLRRAASTRKSRFAVCDATSLIGAWSKLRTDQACAIARCAGRVGGEGGIARGGLSLRGEASTRKSRFAVFGSFNSLAASSKLGSMAAEGAARCAGRVGGEGGIRTPVTREGKAVFKTAAFDRSATSPGCAWPMGREGTRRKPKKKPRLRRAFPGGAKEIRTLDLRIANAAL